MHPTKLFIETSHIRRSIQQKEVRNTKKKLLAAFISIFLFIPAITSTQQFDVNLNAIEDVTLYDVWLGTVNSSHPMYWGNYTYFHGEKTFFRQQGGVHNHAYAHTTWNTTPYIKSVRNCLFNSTENRLHVYHNQTIVTFSNDTTVWLDNKICPLNGDRMHAAEFSPYSMALYWFCDEDRLIIGELYS